MGGLGLFSGGNVSRDERLISLFQQEMYRHISGDQQFAGYVNRTFERLETRIAKLEQEVANAKGKDDETAVSS